VTFNQGQLLRVPVDGKVLSALGGSQVGIDNEAQEVKASVHAPQPVVEKVGCGRSAYNYFLAGFPYHFGMKTAQKARRVMAVERGRVLRHSPAGRVAMVHRRPSLVQIRLVGARKDPYGVPKYHLTSTQTGRI
jgi:hypothetical protein